VLTRALALELRERDITVNGVFRGRYAVRTRQVADVIAYLLSEQAGVTEPVASGSAIPDCINVTSATPAPER
jgi:NAD(P)-dependent dehydrogenase (short-subunit alcohol dehydrogenase family)